VFFTGFNEGYVAGSGAILKTTNAGETWTQIYNTAQNIESVFFIDSVTGYMTSWYSEVTIDADISTVFKTIDRGNTWYPLVEFTDKRILSICFTDSLTGYIIGDRMGLMKTIDGGSHWETQVLGVNFPFSASSIYFTETGNGFIAGSRGAILKTTSGSEGIADEPDEYNNIRIFPNPAGDNIYVEMPANIPFSGITLFTVNDINGREMIKQRIYPGKTEVDISRFSKGVYIIIVNDEKDIVI
jgi:hypothetical protein